MNSLRLKPIKTVTMGVMKDEDRVSSFECYVSVKPCKTPERLLYLNVFTNLNYQRYNKWQN
jgi:hypothetical protein